MYPVGACRRGGTGIVLNKAGAAWHWLLDLGVQVTGIQYPGVGLGLIALAILLAIVRLERWVRTELSTPDSGLKRSATIVRRHLIPIMLSAMGLAGLILIGAAVAGGISYYGKSDQPTSDDLVKLQGELSSEQFARKLAEHELDEAKNKLQTVSLELEKIRNPPPIALKPLTEDQRQFRVGLKQFSLTCVPRLANAMGAVFRQMTDREMQIAKGSPTSIALHFYIHAATSADFLGISNIRELAEAKIENMDVTALQRLLVIFFDQYAWQQKGIGNMEAIVMSDIVSQPEMKAWLKIDEECRSELNRLKIWPEADKGFRAIRETEMASGGSNLWLGQYPVNYR
jgi:hypothetical protein